jgi:hypothetical protein
MLRSIFTGLALAGTALATSGNSTDGYYPVVTATVITTTTVCPVTSTFMDVSIFQNGNTNSADMNPRPELRRSLPHSPLQHLRSPAVQEEVVEMEVL